MFIVIQEILTYFRCCWCVSQRFWHFRQIVRALDTQHTPTNCPVCSHIHTVVIEKYQYLLNCCWMLLNAESGLTEWICQTSCISTAWLQFCHFRQIVRALDTQHTPTNCPVCSHTYCSYWKVPIFVAESHNRVGLTELICQI